jgi:hypothetical protein
MNGVQIKIEKNIPIPERKHDRLGPVSSALKTMEVGDSFVLTDKDARNIGATARRLDLPITLRRTEPGKHRVWRVAEWPQKGKGKKPGPKKGTPRPEPASPFKPDLS